jgi:hypothetical protein
LQVGVQPTSSWPQVSAGQSLEIEQLAGGWPASQWPLLQTYPPGQLELAEQVPPPSPVGVVPGVQKPLEQVWPLGQPPPLQVIGGSAATQVPPSQVKPPPHCALEVQLPPPEPPPPLG